MVNSFIYMENKMKWNKEAKIVLFVGLFFLLFSSTACWWKRPLPPELASHYNYNYNCDPETGNGQIEISVETSKINGVAPLSVFFDATGTTGLTNNCFFSENAAYMDATFSWNFDADNIDPTGNHKHASGFVAAHVFERPGIYRVHLDVYDANGDTASVDISIEVSAFSGTTYYVATNGSNSNDGLSMTTAFQTPGHALSSSILGPNVRVLFRNGDVFTISNQVTISNIMGPVIIGAYSDPANPSSEKPIIWTTAINSDWATIHFANCTDMRIMDIAARATSESSYNPRYPYGIGWNNNCSHMLKYRTEEYENGGMSLSPCGQYNTIAECEFHNTTQTGFTSSDYGPNDGAALIGNWVYDKNLVDQNNEEHIFRLQNGSRYFIAYNTFGPHIRVNYDAITIRGNSEKVVIYKNRMEGWVQAIWPQNRNSADEYQHHCIMDSNLIIGIEDYPNARGGAIALSSKDIVIRNNIIYDYEYGIGINSDRIVGPSQRIKVHNNTFINPRAGSTFYAIHVNELCHNIEIKNNLMVDLVGSNPSYTGFLDIRSGSVLNGSSDYNMFYGGILNASFNLLFDGRSLDVWCSSTNNDLNSFFADPGLASVDYNAANFCMLQIGSWAIDGGDFSSNSLDYYGNLRDNAHDIGACEY